MIKINEATIKPQLSQAGREIVKKNRAAAGRAMRATMQMVQHDLELATPIMTGSLKKSWRRYSNVEKGGDSAYGLCFIDKTVSYTVRQNKKQKYVIRKIKKNMEPPKGVEIKKPYQYAWWVEAKKQFVKKCKFSNTIKWIKTYEKHLMSTM